MQLGHDDFERRLARHLRMVFHRNAAAVVADRQEALRVHMHFDEVRVSRDCLVHRVVDDFGEEIVQRLLVGAADIHAGTHAHRLQPFENANGRGIVGIGVGGRWGRARRRRCRRRRSRRLDRIGRAPLGFGGRGQRGKEIVLVVHRAFQIGFLRRMSRNVSAHAASFNPDARRIGRDSRKHIGNIFGNKDCVEPSAMARLNLIHNR